MIVRRVRDRKGATAVELACVAPVLVALEMSILESSRLGMVSQLLTTAAREGCRSAVLPGATQASVQARINEVLAGSGIPAGTVTPTCDDGSAWATATQPTAITVSMSVPYSKVSWLAIPYFLKNATVSASATFSSERPVSP
jgi:Flp pilus assembly protein TadG